MITLYYYTGLTLSEHKFFWGVSSFLWEIFSGKNFAKLVIYHHLDVTQTINIYYIYDELQLFSLCNYVIMTSCISVWSILNPSLIHTILVKWSRKCFTTTSCPDWFQQILDNLTRINEQLLPLKHNFTVLSWHRLLRSEILRMSEACIFDKNRLAFLLLDLLLSLITFEGWDKCFSSGQKQ